MRNVARRRLFTALSASVRQWDWRARTLSARHRHRDRMMVTRDLSRREDVASMKLAVSRGCD